MICVVNFVFLPFSQLTGVDWEWPGRREPDDEHSPASEGGGGIASSSSLFFTYLYCYSYRVYFVCDSVSELERWALLPFWGFSCPSLLHIFLNLLFLGTSCYIFFRNCWDFRWVFFFSVSYFGLACDHGNSFLG